MSHEIRTPMNGILGFAELLKEPGLSNEQQQEYIQIIEKGGARMLNIINDIMSISKIESGTIEVNNKETNINEHIEFIYNFFKPELEAKGMNLSFKNALLSNQSVIITDSEKVYSILTNLVKNAIKYSKKGSIAFGYEKKDNYLEFYVKDTGIGIPKDRQKAIFERFIQADIQDKNAYQGAGLGLSISKAYVEMLNGKIWVESEVGVGSCFYFTLPYNVEREEKNVFEKVILLEKENNLLKNLKILIADDDDVTRMIISMAVKRFCKDIIEVENGIEVLEACRNNPDIDLIIMDVKMPEMDGYEATKQIRKFNNDVIIILQSAFTLSGEKENAALCGCNDYLPKPFTAVSLIALLNKHFKK
jgi:CheY-like chemotaxis protein